MNKEVVKEKTWLNAEMPITLAESIKGVAQERGVSASAIVRWALKDYLQKLAKQGGSDGFQVPQR